MAEVPTTYSAHALSLGQPCASPLLLHGALRRALALPARDADAWHTVPRIREVPLHGIDGGGDDGGRGGSGGTLYDVQKRQRPESKHINLRA